jgi:uncharacterized protein Usg
MVDINFDLLLQDNRLTTAEILYHMPDYPDLLQTYIWQELDKAPEFPTLYKFLNFWEQELEGKLNYVKVVSCELIKPFEINMAGFEMQIN